MKSLRLLTRLPVVFPFLVLAFLYGTWGAGRFALGYWPRSSLDDPKHIEGGLMWMYDATACLIYFGVPLFCVAVAALAVVLLARRPEGWRNGLIELGVAVVAFVGLVLLCRWDPHSVVEWFFD